MEDFSKTDRWRMVLGAQWNRQMPSLHYESHNDSSNPTLDINKCDAGKIVEPFSYINVRRRLSNHSNIDLSYTKDRSSSVLVGRKNIVLMGFLLRPTFQSPVYIDVEAVRLRYSHRIVRVDNFEFGGSGGLQALYVNAHASLPVLGYRDENYFVVVPCVGVYANYQQNKNMGYSVRADYLPIELDKISARVSDIDFTAEYKLNSTIFVGAGCRYSLKSLSLDNKKKLINSSYGVFGGLVVMGIYF